MKILHRYVAQIYLRFFALCLGAFTAIYLVVDFMERIGRFTRAGGEWQHIALYFLTKIPEIVGDAAPLAVLMSTLLTLGTLSMNSELTAMRGCGVSLTRISYPIVMLALLISVLTLLIGELVIPPSFAQRTYIQEVLIQKKSPNAFFRQQNIWYRDRGTILRASLFDPGSSSLKGVTLWELDEKLTPVRRVDAATGTLTAGGWVLKDAVIRDVRTGEPSGTRSVATLQAPLKLKPEDLKVLGKYSDNMTIEQLRRYCEKLKAGGYDPTRYLAQMHGRIALPFSSAIMAFLGIPFSLRSSRSSGIAKGIGVSLVIGFLYTIINSVILSFGQAGALPPVVAAWAANFIFLMAGIWLCLTVES